MLISVLYKPGPLIAVGVIIFMYLLLLGVLGSTSINFNSSKNKRCNYIHFNVTDEITYPFTNFNGAAVEVLEWIINSIP